MCSGGETVIGLVSDFHCKSRKRGSFQKYRIQSIKLTRPDINDVNYSNKRTTCVCREGAIRVRGVCEGESGGGGVQGA